MSGPDMGSEDRRGHAHAQDVRVCQVNKLVDFLIR